VLVRTSQERLAYVRDGRFWTLAFCLVAPLAAAFGCPASSDEGARHLRSPRCAAGRGGTARVRRCGPPKMAPPNAAVPVLAWLVVGLCRSRDASPISPRWPCRVQRCGRVIGALHGIWLISPSPRRRLQDYRHALLEQVRILGTGARCASRPIARLVNRSDQAFEDVNSARKLPPFDRRREYVPRAVSLVDGAVQIGRRRSAKVLLHGSG